MPASLLSWQLWRTVCALQNEEQHCCIISLWTVSLSQQHNCQRSRSTQRLPHQRWIRNRDGDCIFRDTQSAPLSAYSMSKWMIFILPSHNKNRIQSFVSVSLVCSFCSSILIVDPTSEEESLSTAQLTVVTDEEGRLCSVHKPGQKN